MESGDLAHSKKNATRGAIPENIFLVGLMGAGKTTVGKLLAKRFNKSFFDTDHEIERLGNGLARFDADGCDPLPEEIDGV